MPLANHITNFDSTRAPNSELISHISTMVHAGALDTVLWVTMQWKDARLAWDPKEYHDLQEIRYKQGVLISDGNPDKGAHFQSEIV